MAKIPGSPQASRLWLRGIPRSRFGLVRNSSPRMGFRNLPGDGSVKIAKGLHLDPGNEATEDVMKRFLILATVALTAVILGATNAQAQLPVGNQGNAAAAA